LFLACLPAFDMADEATAARVLGAIRDTGGSHAERKRLTAIILKRATAGAREILVGLAVQRGPAPYRRRPFPDGLPPNPACTFQCTGLSSDLYRVRDGVCVDPFMAVGADDKCLAPLFRH
jgi:hypothetical protein